MKFLTILITALFAAASGANAQTVSLGSLVEEARSNNPEIKAYRTGSDALAMKPPQEGALPNPLIGVGMRNVSFSDITVGDDPMSNYHAFIEQDIPFPGKLSLREDIAENEARSGKWMSDAIERKVIAELKRAYFDWYFILKSIEVTEDNKKLLEQFIGIAEVKYEVGSGYQQDVLRAQVELSGFLERLELLSAKKEIIEARIRKILARPQSSTLGEPAPVEKTGLNLSYDELSVLADENAPVLKSAAEDIAGSEKSVELANKGYYPDFVVGASYMNRDGGSENLDDIWEINLGFRVPLYYMKKERYGVKQAALELAQSRESYESAKNDILFELKESYLTADTAGKLIDLYASGIVPQSETSLESAVSGYQVGDVDFLTLLNNVVTLYNFELEYHRQLVEHEKAIARIEELSGVDLMSYGRGNMNGGDDNEKR